MKDERSRTPDLNASKKLRRTGGIVLLLSSLVLSSCDRNAPNPPSISTIPTEPPIPLTPQVELPQPTPTAQLEVSPSQYNEAAKLFRETMLHNLDQLYRNTASKLTNDELCIRGEIPSDLQIFVTYEVETSRGSVQCLLIPQLGTEDEKYDDFGIPKSVSVSLKPTLNCTLPPIQVYLTGEESAQDGLSWQALQIELLTNPITPNSLRMLSTEELPEEYKHLGTNWSESYGVVLSANAGWIAINHETQASHPVLRP